MATGRFLRPYAVNAIVEHEFDTDHLNIWVTFRFPMDTSIKPPNALWTVTVDDVDKPIDASTWQDFWRILLNVPNVAQIPERVLLAYDGPSPLLKTTWGKQWEPWADILSEGPIAMPFGSFKGNEINWQQVAAEDTWYTISHVGITVGTTYKTTFQNNQELLIAEAGKYQIHYYLSVECSIAGKHVLTAVEVDGVQLNVGMTHYEFGRANEESTWGAPCLANLIVGRKVSIGISTDDPGNPTLTVQHVGLILTKIFGS